MFYWFKFPSKSSQFDQCEPDELKMKGNDKIIQLGLLAWASEILTKYHGFTESQ